MKALLMGGQACILYGAAEFSRDVDVAVLASEKNIQQLRAALLELKAEPVFVPSLGQQVLLRGHACHFRAQAAESEGIRIDIMSVLHGCAPFEQLWRRRRKFTLTDVGSVNVLSLPDLVQAKKTQRDKDWPMVRRLIEVDYHRRPAKPSRAQITFWLREARTPELLVQVCSRYSAMARRLTEQRPALQYALSDNLPEVARVLRAEEDAYRAADQEYWRPLRAELYEWRRSRRKA